MATNYPGAIDSLTNPSSGDALTSPSHAAQHANANDAIEAIETELGTTPSGSESTVAARLTAIENGTRMGAGSIGASALADNAVDTAAIQDGAVTAAKLATTGRFLFPTGAANGYGFTGGAVHLSGTGSPEGVVTAAPGSTWLQTDATTDVKGWIRWVKATGTGTTGWVAGPEADTGWRNVTSLLVNGWSAASGSVKLRRVGSRITVRFRYLEGGSASANTIITLPTGFNFIDSLDFPGVSGSSTLFIVSAGGGVLNSEARPSYAFCEIDFVCDSATAAWPATLPGSAA